MAGKTFDEGGSSRGAVSRSAGWLPDGILGESEVAGLTVLLQESPERFEAVCDLLMDCYRSERLPEAFSLLYQLNRPRFERRVRSLLGRRTDPTLVDDVLSEVFLAIWMYPDRFDAGRDNAFRNWSHTIIRHKTYRALRPPRTEHLGIEELEQRAIPADAMEPADVVAAREEVVALSEHYVLMLLMVDSLFQSETTERERLALRMVDLEGRDSAEVARALGVKLGNLRMILCRGRRKINVALARVGGRAGSATECRVGSGSRAVRRVRRAA
jgi:RNA polymerase sigma factor (sigma-70 family)